MYDDEINFGDNLSLLNPIDQSAINQNKFNPRKNQL